MPDIIRLKRSGVAGAAPTSLELGEPALNYADGVIYYKNSSGAIVAFGGGDALLRSLFVPPAPTSVTATAGNAQAAVSWTAPSVLAQTPITDFVVQYSSNSGSSWTTFSDGTSATASATVTGLTNGTAYTFRVAAVNGAGQGAWSTASSAVTPAAAQFVAIPTMTSNTTPSGTASASSTLYNGSEANMQPYGPFDGDPVNFPVWYSSNPGYGYNFPHWIQYDFGGTPSLIGGYTIRPYYVSYDARPSAWTFSGSNDGVTFTTLDTRSEVPAYDVDTTYNLSSPVAYSVYRWTFTAGNSTLVIISRLTVVAPPSAPGAPTSVSATAGNAQLALTWTAPASNGGSAITGYTVEYTPSGGSPATANTGSAATSYTLTGLTNGTSYTVRVRAVNAVGNGTYSTAVTGTPVAVTAPGPVASFSVSGGGCGSVSVVWQAPVSDGGSAITGYRVIGSSAGWGGHNVLYSAASRSANIGGPDDQSVRLEIFAINAVGSSTGVVLNTAFGYCN